MASLAELVVKVGADISEFTRNMQSVDRSMKSMGKGMMNVGGSIKQVGQSMFQNMTLPILGIGTAMVVTQANFEKQMSSVQAVTGATGKDMEKLTEQAKELGKTTVWSASEAGAGMEYLARAGFSVNEVYSAMPAMLALATASNTDLATTADIASNILTGFGMQATESGRMADVLAYAVANSNTNMYQLGDAMKYVAPVASSVGWSIEETASAIGAMSDAGIQGSMAGTALRGGLSRLVKPSKEAKDLMDDLGMSFFNSTGEMKSMPEVIQELESKLGGLNEEQRLQAISTIFGQEAMAGWLALIGRGSEDLGNFTGELEGSQGKAEEMAKTMSDNLAGSFKAFLSAVEGVAISFGEVMNPVLRSITDRLTELTAKFDKLSPSAKGMIVVGALIVASIAPLLIIIGLVAQGIGALAIAFGAISAPVLIVIGVIAGLIAVFVLLWNKSETFRNTMKSVFEGIKTAVQTAIGAVADFLKQKFAEIQAFWDEHGSQILQAVQNVWNFILGVFQFVMPAILFVVQYVWEAIKGVINGALNIIMGIVKVFTGLFTGDFSLMWEGVKQLFFGAIQFLWNLMSLSFVKGILSAIKGLAKGAWGAVKSMWETIQLRFLYGKDKVVSLLNALKSAGMAIWGAIRSTIASVVQSIWNFVRSIFTNLRSTVTSIFNGIRSVASSVWNGIRSVITSVVNGIRSGVTSSFNAIKSTATTIFNAVKTAITRPIESAKNTVLGIIGAIKSAFSAMKITIPKPKLPKISVSMKKGAMGIPYPDFNVSWNAKGGIFNGASILGGGQGVGEAGAEAVLPIQHKRYMKPFASAVASHLDSSGGQPIDVTVHVHAHSVVDLDGEQVGRIVAPVVTKEIEKEQNKNNRFGGRVVYGNV